MEILMVLATLGVMVLGFLILKRMGPLINRGGMIDKPRSRFHTGFLVFGSPEEAATIRAHGYRCSEASVAAFATNIRYSALFALSDDDAANLQVCNAAKSDDPCIYIIARCNNDKMYGTYQDLGADYVLQAGEPISGILAELRDARHEK